MRGAVFLVGRWAAPLIQSSGHVSLKNTDELSNIDRADRKNGMRRDGGLDTALAMLCDTFSRAQWKW